MEKSKDISEILKNFDLDIDLFTFALDICTQGYYIANLTKDIFLSDIVWLLDGEKNVFDGTQDFRPPFSCQQFFDWWAEHMILKETTEYKKVNSLEYLEKYFHTGNKFIQKNYKTKILNGDIKTVVQTTMLSRDKISGDLLALTIINIYREDQIQISEPSYNRNIIQTLANDYEAVFYVDLKNDSISAVRATQEFLKRNPKISNIVVYTTFMKYLVANAIVKEDIEPTLLALTKKNIYREFNQKDFFFINYRIKNTAGNIFYHQLKIAKTNDWEYNRTLIIGIHNVDEETKNNLEQVERIKQQSETNLQMSAVINTLSSDFDDIFYIEIDKDRVFEFRTSSLFKKIQQDMSELYTSIPSFCNTLQQLALEYIHEEDQQKVLLLISPRKLREIFTKESSFYEDFRVKVNNEYVYYQLKLVLDTRIKNEFSIVFGLRNIDSQRRAEIENQAKLENALVSAKEASKAKSTFLFNMSHDIRTPMNAIIGYTSMAEKHLYDPQRVSEYLEKVKLSSNHLLKLINDVLDMARIENGKINIEEKSFHLKNCIDNIIEIERISAEKNQLKLELEYENLKTKYIIGDSFRLNQIFLNIIGNSIKYTTAGGKITVLVRENKSNSKKTASFSFIVKDTGIGMSEEFVSHIFEMFSRERNTTSSGVQGTGLGMAIVKNLIDLMNGTIDIKSKINEGTTVSLNLNFKIPNAKTIDSENETESASVRIELKNKKVLVVEDNSLNREIAKDMLEEEGLIVEEANDGTIAVEKIKNSKPGDFDFVLMDVQMPFMDGYTATQTIRQLKDNQLANIPIIAMTANAFEEDRKKAIESGMDAHLSKPIQPALLFNTISEIISKPTNKD